MKGAAVAGTVSALLLLATSGARADWPQWEFAQCMDAGPTVDIFECGGAAASVDPELRKLAVIACVADKINQYQMKVLDCLQSQVDEIHAVVMLPREASRAIREFTAVLEEGRTLKQQVESIACGWRFSRRTELLRDLYLKPIRLCRPEVKFILGDHAGMWDADVQELYDWTSKNTHNLVHDRSVGPGDEKGNLDGPSPEQTWQKVASETAGRIEALDPGQEDQRSQGWALRYGAQLTADRLQVQANTLQLRSWRLFVGQQHRDYRALKKHGEAAARAWVLAEQASSSSGEERQ